MIVVRGALGLVGVWLVAACDTGKVSPNPHRATARDSAEQVLYGGRSVLASNGVRRGDISGDTVLVFSAATRFELIGLRAQFMSTLGRPLSMMASPTGTYRIPAGRIIARGRVTIVSDTSHRRLEGTLVRYDLATNQLSSDSEFVATSGTRRLSGVGFTADPGLFTVKCAQRCTGSLGP
jgi:hypothetical protein